jgi:hypothetical protein
MDNELDSGFWSAPAKSAFPLFLLTNRKFRLVAHPCAFGTPRFGTPGVVTYLP